MKKLAIIISLVLIFPNIISAQEKKHDITIGYGMITHYALREITVNLTVTILSVDYVNTVYKSGSGAFSLGYRFSPVKRLTIGIDGVYQKIKNDVKTRDDNDPILIGKLERQFLSTAILTSFRYIDKETFQMYSGIGVGYTFGKYHYVENDGEEDFGNSGQFAGHLNALGIRFGSTIGGFVELGYGYKGMLNFGLSVQL